MPGTTVSTAHVLTHSLLITALQRFCPQSTEDRTEHRGEGTYPGSQLNGSGGSRPSESVLVTTTLLCLYENQLVVMSRGWRYPEYSHGRDGERGPSCFSERAGAWVDPPRRALLCRVPYTTGSAPFCFLAPVHVTVEHSQSIHVLAFVCSIMVKIECVSFCCGKAMKILVPLVSGIFSVISLVSCSQCKCLL